MKKIFTPLNNFVSRNYRYAISNGARKNGFSLVELLVIISIIGLILIIGILNFPAMRQQLALDRAAHQLVQEIRKAQGLAMSAAELKQEDCSCLPRQLALADDNLLVQSNPSIILTDARPGRLLKDPLILGPEVILTKGYGIYINLENNNKSYKLYSDTNAEINTSDCQLLEPCWEYYDSGDCVYETISIEEQGIIIKEIDNIDTTSTGTGGVQKVSINFKPPNPNTNIKWLDSDASEVKIILALESNPDNPLNQRTIAINRAGLVWITE